MDAIKNYHPAVGFCFFLLMIIISLASMHPVFQCTSFVAVVLYGIAVSGLSGFLRGSWWVALLILIVALFNMVFGGQGLTVFFTLDLGFMRTQITLEGLVYGLMMGLMLANVILWFNVLAKLSSMQGFIELFSRVSPTAGMMIARITVFIPELLDQSKLVDRAQRTFVTKKGSNPGSSSMPDERAPTPTITATSAPAVAAAGASLGSEPASQLIDMYEPSKESKRSTKALLAYAGTLSSHLMEWGMEKSLITANSMVARGYGSRKRTSYRRTRLTLRDVIPLICILALGVTALVCAIWAGTHYQYYPYLGAIELWWGYLPLVLVCLVPLILQLREELAWWRST